MLLLLIYGLKTTFNLFDKITGRCSLSSLFSDAFSGNIFDCPTAYVSLNADIDQIFPYNSKELVFLKFPKFLARVFPKRDRFHLTLSFEPPIRNSTSSSVFLGILFSSLFFRVCCRSFLEGIHKLLCTPSTTKFYGRTKYVTLLNTAITLEVQLCSL